MIKKLVTPLLSACVLFCAVAPALAAPPATLGGATVGASGALFDAGDVIFPDRIVFTVDPYEKSGRGQIYGEPLRVANHTDQDMDIRIDELLCDLSGGAASAESVDLFDTTGRKDIAMVLRRTDLVDGPVYAIGELPGEPIDFTLGPGQAAVFELGGAVSPNPSAPWEPENVAVRMTFLCRPTAPEITLFEEDADAKPFPEEVAPPEEQSLTIGISPHPNADEADEPEARN